MPNKFYQFPAFLKKESDLAYLLHDGKGDFWVPKSLIAKMEKVKNTCYNFVIPKWLASQKRICK